jgi:hypothetical protein
MSAFVIDPYRFAAFSPANVSGLKVWLDAGVGLFDATTGGSAVTTDGSSVARWEDQSGNGNHVTQATSGQRPELKTNIQNGRDVVRFTATGSGATDDFLRASSTVISGTTARTIFMVVKATTTGQNGIVGFGGGSGTGQTFDITPEIRVRMVGRQDFNLSMGTTAFRILTIGCPSSALFPDVYGYLDGVAMSGTPTSPTAAVNTTTTVGFTVGRSAQGGLGHVGGDYCEILAYDENLSTANRESVERYLADKWGVTI